MGRGISKVPAIGGCGNLKLVYTAHNVAVIHIKRAVFIKSRGLTHAVFLADFVAHVGRVHCDNRLGLSVFCVYRPIQPIG